MTPAPEQWRRWKRSPRAETLERAQAANDRRFSRARMWRVVILIASVLAIAMAAWLPRSPEQSGEGVVDALGRASAAITCLIEAGPAPGRSDTERSGRCMR